MAEKIIPAIYGLMAEFDNDHALLSATRKAFKAGYRKMDAYTPIPVEGLVQALGRGKTHVPLLCLIGGIVGGGSAYAMQYIASVIHYPLNIGGRPFHSWPAFIPITFELTVLFATFFTAFGMLALNGLPMPYHPVFNVPAFKLASRDRFFLCIEATDPLFSLIATRDFLTQLAPLSVHEVEP